MKKVTTLILAIFSVQVLMINNGLAQFTPESQFSPGNSGDLSSIDVQKTYTCSLTSNIPKTPRGFETELKSIKVVSSGKASFLTYSIHTDEVEVTILTNFSTIATVEIKDLKTGFSALTENNSPFGDDTSIAPATLIDSKKNLQYSVYCNLSL